MDEWGSLFHVLVHGIRTKSRADSRRNRWHRQRWFPRGNFSLSSQRSFCYRRQVHGCSEVPAALAVAEAPPRTHSFDIGRRSELTRLYNQPVRRVTHVERPLTGLSTMVGPIRHSGVVVETQDGRRMLIHKGKDYGRSSQTVVTDARHMSSNWRPVQSRPVSGSSVGDFVRAGGRDYSTIGDNCHNGRCRMMALP
ncbi:hypothetical protein LSAT2_001390 [Lamellibrachia satsuma]|nr:hypothetical protein LSAT2_001390 [Lamellibrachia satsuma]